MNEARRRAILETAARDPDLVAQLQPVVAAGFGVLALRRLGDVLTVACFHSANQQALCLLREVLELEIVATPFEHDLLHEAIREAYFSGGESVNFPTFRDPEFLDDPDSAVLLREEKVEDLPPASFDLSADHLALCCMTYRSELRNLDAPNPGKGLPDPLRIRLELGDLEDGWRVEDGRIHVYGALTEKTRLVMTEYRLTEHRHLRGGGRISEHDVRTRFVEELPLIVHPTEIQLVQVKSDGTLGLHVYDGMVQVPPGQPTRIDLAYHFLNYGNTMHRTIRLDVHEVLSVAKNDFELHEEPSRWRAVELGRWFGLEPGEVGRTHG